ncbi:MAG TPA: aminomethyl transferase family protein, partial [Thermoanaerobaculia bacterium]|nr:aminomethyl transferase family protein [Thermoanaerobaculia bacterium]
GIPRFGRDFGPDNFPQETGIEEAVSYTKGCYLGQEVVARIHYRGGVQNVLRKLTFEGIEPAQGVALLHDGREAGRATTVVGSMGLGILHRRAAEPGTRVEVEGGGTALVRP